MKQVRVGVIGVGHLGKLHASLYKDVPDAELVGVFDTDEKKCKSVADELKIRPFNNLVQMYEAVEAVNDYAPEHMIVKCSESNKNIVLENIKNAGEILKG